MRSRVITKNGIEDKLHTTTFTEEGALSLDNLQKGDMVEFSYSVQGRAHGPLHYLVPLKNKQMIVRNMFVA